MQKAGFRRFRLDLLRSSGSRSPTKEFAVFTRSPNRLFSVLLVVGTSLPCSGCLEPNEFTAPRLAPVPRELAQVSLPPYVIGPPDLLLIDALTVVPRPPYRIQPLDAVLVQFNVENLPRDFPPQLLIAGIYPVGPDGLVNLGLNYQSIRFAGLTLRQAKLAVEERLRGVLKPEWSKVIQVTVELAQSRAMQQIRGEHLVRPDGTVSLGIYGGVYVAGLTLDEAKKAVEGHLSQFLLNPEVSVDVAGYNSKNYYVITDGAGSGEQVVRLPITGNETVLDAISLVNGLAPVASKGHIWVARPAPAEKNCIQVLPVDWRAIVKGGSTATNYQILPGDRIYVDSQALIKTDNFLAKFISPMERVLGVTLLGDSTVRSFKTTTGTGTTSP
jgi:polysaccharide export outer membrane protein